jgi:uncharacterized membrane protein
MDSCLGFVILMFAIASFVVAMLTRSRLEKAEAEIRRLREDVGARVSSPAPASEAPAFSHAPVSYGAPPPSAAPVWTAPEVVPTSYASEVREASRPKTLEVPLPFIPPAHEGAGEDTRAPMEPPAPGPLPDTGRLKPAPTSPALPFDWESVVGVKLFSWIAGIALVLAAVFFLKYSVEHGWVSPAVRAFVGITTGVALIVICELRIAANYRVTANAMHGAAIAILYATLFSMHALWGIVPASVAFLLMLVVTGVAVFLSVRRDSVFIALLGLLGGFATPALLSSGENRPIVLFSYLFLLNAGLAWIAWWKRWPALTALSVILTAFYQWGWIVKFLSASQLPLAAGIFVTFAVVAALGLWLGRREEDRNQVVFDRIATAGAALPLLFAVFTAAMPIYASRYNTLFGFLILIAAGLAAISIKRRTAWLHQLGGVVVLMTFAVWVSVSYTSSAWPIILAWVVAFMALYLVAATRLESHGADTSALLFFMFAALAAVEPATQWPIPLFAVALLMLAVVGFYAIRRDAPRVYVVAGVVLFIALCVWTANHLGRENVAAALAVYTAFAFVILATAVAAERFGRRVGAYLAPAIGVLFIVVATRNGLSIPPTLLLSALTATTIACAFVSMFLRRPMLLAGSLASAQTVLIAWAAVATTGSWPTVAMIAALAVAAIGVVCFFIDRSTGDALALAVGFGHGVIIVASAAGAASIVWTIAGHVTLLITALVVAAMTGKHALATIEVVFVTLGAAIAHTDGPGQELALASSVYAPLVLYPILIGERARRSMQPYIAAIAMSVSFFFLARHAIVHAGLEDFIGALPLLQAALLGVLVKTLLRIEPPGERLLSRLALTAGAALAFVTVAIPLQLDKEWITIAWALEAAALVWLFRKVPHNGLLVAAAALFATVFVRLVLNPAVFNYHPGSDSPIVNWYLYTFLVPAAAFFVGARLLREEWATFRTVLNAAGTVLLFILLNVEIADFYSSGPTLTFNFLTSSLAQELTYTIGWALFAIGILIAGIALRVRGARIAALALLFVTILKCFLHDLGRLGGLYRVGSLLGLAISLVLVGVLLQKFVMIRNAESERTEPAPTGTTS